MALNDQRRSRMTRSTAEGAAMLRAAGALVRDPELRGSDTMAARMIGPGLSAATLVKVPLLRRLAPVIIERLLPGGLWFEIGRTKAMDQYVREEVAAGAAQVVILGAGLDSRAYRMPELSATTVFEIDHPVTAAYKAQRVRAVVGAPPANVRYVQIDFETQDLAGTLAASGFDPTTRTAIVWSGVCPYLPAEAVDAILAWVAGIAPGSTIVFDYCTAELVEGELDHIPAARKLRDRVAAQGEPFRFGIPEGTTREYLAERGLDLVSDMSAEEGRRRFVSRADGTGPQQTWSFGGLAIARSRIAT